MKFRSEVKRIGNSLTMSEQRLMATVVGQGKTIESMKLVGYVPRHTATAKTYTDLGFKCGLEIHQQLKTDKKLFCRCPAAKYGKFDEFDAEIVRHMRPTLSELGEYDGTALMEFKTRKNIIYRIRNESACTYDIDDTPPFALNRQALSRALEIALALKTNVVGELHIARKQYLDGSIPTGFQRTGIIGIDGEIPLSGKTVRIIQISIEEDSCREVSDVGHFRTFSTDRLGTPLIEMVTYPDLLTPDEAIEAGQYLRLLARSCGVVRTGIGAARQDVNVSIKGGTRVEIKGVAHLKWIPELTHNEAFRQKALLKIKKLLGERKIDAAGWKISSVEISSDTLDYLSGVQSDALPLKLRMVNLPQFDGILSFFTQPGKSFADEISERLKVIACLDSYNMIHSQQSQTELIGRAFAEARKELKSSPTDVQILVWGPDDDLPTSLETIEERCRLAFEGVPNETRKALPDGTTIFERVLPGPDRMYPDTDSAPIPIDEEMIAACRKSVTVPVDRRMAQLAEWQAPDDTHLYILRNNLMPQIESVVDAGDLAPAHVCCLFGHRLKGALREQASGGSFDFNRIVDLCAKVAKAGLDRDIISHLLPLVCRHPDEVFDSLLKRAAYKKFSREQILSKIPTLRTKYSQIRTAKEGSAEGRWIMGCLRPSAIGNLPLRELRKLVDEALANG